MYIHYIKLFLDKVEILAQEPRETQQQHPLGDSIQFTECSTENYGIAFNLLKNAFRNL